jgi:hypothetical protein
MQLIVFHILKYYTAYVFLDDIYLPASIILYLHLISSCVSFCLPNSRPVLHRHTEAKLEQIRGVYFPCITTVFIIFWGALAPLRASPRVFL